MKNKLEKTMLVLLACLLLLTPLSAAAEDESFITIAGIKRGDVSGDKSINALDYIQLKRHVLGSYRLSGNAVYAADLNLDGTVDALDYIILKKIVLGTYKLQVPDLDTPVAELSDEELKKRINYLLLSEHFAGVLLVSFETDVTEEEAIAILENAKNSLAHVESFTYGGFWGFSSMSCYVQCTEETIRDVMFALLRSDGISLVSTDRWMAPC